MEHQVQRPQRAPHEAAQSRLLSVTPDAEAVVAGALDEVLGLGAGVGLDQVMDPGRNPTWNDTLNTWDHSPALRTLRHVHLTFRKRLSLTAYAQDQRHRLTPGSRPLLGAYVDDPPIVVPDIIAADDEARTLFDAAITALAKGRSVLRALGVPETSCAYLLPNATEITFTQSGDLLGWIHKWRLRLCFNAQKEIYDASLEELRQAQAAIPALLRFVGPPCTFVAAGQPKAMQDDVKACCPEGPRWCGIKVWKNFDAAKGTPRRPF